MNKVISINLGGRAYQLEEGGYNLLTEYFRQAGEKLTGDPDKGEIIADLERAVAEKFDRLLKGGKTVILQNEVETTIKEMGQVEGGGETTEKLSSAEAVPKKTKRLYRLEEGKVIAGVCAGLAAYFDIDVTLVRAIFVILALFTHGAMVAVYIIMMIIIPKAKTPEEISSAYGEPLTAQELANRVREEFSQVSDKSKWEQKKQEWKRKRQEWREKRREWRLEWRQDWNGRYHGSGFWGLIVPAFIVFWIIGLVSIISGGIIFGFVIPAAWPIWVVVIFWIMIFPAAVSALSGGCRRGHCHGGGIFSLLWLVFIGWLIWHFFPDSHHFFHQIEQGIESAWQAVKNS
jgi:phage shock protein PspC (stress-responsive transcriptional regulator)